MRALSLYERVAASLIGTPLQRSAEWLRRAKGARFRRTHPELSELFQEEARIDDVMRKVVGTRTNCIDIGCHLGSYLQKIVALAPVGRHHAFEPVPQKAAWLRKKFPTVTIREIALSDINEKRGFFVNFAKTALSGLSRASSGGANDSLLVECRRLDDVMDEATPIGFIKIDVNGAELGALQGARRLLQRERPFVLLGCTRGGLDDYRISSDEVFDFLVKQVDYNIFLLKDYLSGTAPLDAAAFRTSMTYPFQAFNYLLVPTDSPTKYEPTPG